MNRRLRCAPPKQTLAQRSGRSMRPISLPAGLKTCTPSSPASPMPQPHQRLPSISTRKPSGVPLGPASMKVLRFFNEFSSEHVKSKNLPRLRARLDDVQNGFVGREREAVGLVDAFGDDGGLARGVQPVDVGGQFRFGLRAFVPAEDAEARVGEPDRAVRLADDVVRRVEALALEAVDQRDDPAVVLGARDPAPAVLAGQQASPAVAGVAVGVARGLAEHARLRRSPRPSATCSCPERRSTRGISCRPAIPGPRPSASARWPGARPWRAAGGSG